MKERIEDFIDSFNTSWVHGDLKTMETLLDEKIIFVAPDLKTEIIGKKECIQTIKDYNENAKTDVFNLTDSNIHIWGKTAMVSINYYIEYKMNDQYYKEISNEFWTIVKQNAKWKLAWRAMVRNESVTNDS